MRKEDRRQRPTAAEARGFYVVRGNLVLTGFDSFHSAYRHALNRFGSEDFTVWNEGWGAPGPACRVLPPPRPADREKRKPSGKTKRQT